MPKLSSVFSFCVFPALGRIEYYVPNQQILGDHLKVDCRYVSRRERRKVVELFRVLSEAKSKAYQNPLDYGSLYEAVQFPKYADANQDIQPGSTSPAQIFAAHENTLLQRARKRKRQQDRQKRASAQADTPAAANEADPEVEDNEEYDSENFTEAQILEQPSSGTLKESADFDTSMMYNVDADDERDNFEMPPGKLKYPAVLR